MNFPEEQVKAWMARIRVLLSGWRRHPQFDDIVASAYLGMWRALQHAEAGREPTGLALHGAWFGAQKFLSSHACVTCRTTCRDNERPELISLSDWQTLHSQDGAIRTPVEPDFAPRLIERIAATEELAKMPPRKRAALTLVCLYGLTRKEVMQELNLSRDVVYRLLRGMPGLPYEHPGPVAHNAQRKKINGP